MMAKEKVVYIQNTTDHGIKIRSADSKLVKRFEIARFDNLTGRPTHNGYTALTMAEFDTLFRESKLFSSFLERKWLKKYDALPEDAMTAHDALVEAKRESAEYAQLMEELEQENKELTEKLAKAEAEHKALTEKLAAVEAEKGKKA
jgi:hypothetical protein